MLCFDVWRLHTAISRGTLLVFTSSLSRLLQHYLKFWRGKNKRASSGKQCGQWWKPSQVSVEEMARYTKLAFISFLLSFILYRYIPAYSCNGSFAYTFLSVHGVMLVLWCIWSTSIYPTYFSPFRDLPQPKVRRTCKSDNCQHHFVRVSNI